MSDNLKIIIIGGGTSGISAATRARRINEKAEIIIIEESNHIAYPVTAIPSYLSGIIKNKESLISVNEENLFSIYNIKILKKHLVQKIVKEEKKLIIKNLGTDTIIEKKYDSVIICTGSRFNISKNLNIKAYNFFLLRNFEDATEIKNYIEKTSIKNITLIGCNYFSINIANSLLKNGFNVSIIEKNNKLVNEFDDEFNYLIKDEIAKSGVKLYLETNIKKLIKNENDTIQKIETNYANIDSQLIIYCDNLTPNSSIASNSKINIGKEGGILVNNKMQTNDPDIFAAGSCVETFNRISLLPEISYLIGPAQFQGRVAGTVASGGDMNFTGVLGTQFLKFNKLSIGITGLTEEKAKLAGFDAVSITTFNGNFERFISGATKLHTKIVYDKLSRRLLGALVCGRGEGVDKRLDVFATSIYSKLVVDDLINLNLCYFPEISTYKDSVNICGMVAANILDNISSSIKLSEIDFSKDIVVLDIRNNNEFQKEHLINSLCIPLNELRSRLEEIPKNKSIYIYGHIGLKSYIAERILKGNGFENVYNIDGGITSIKISENMG